MRRDPALPEDIVRFHLDAETNRRWRSVLLPPRDHILATRLGCSPSYLDGGRG